MCGREVYIIVLESLRGSSISVNLNEVGQTGYSGLRMAGGWGTEHCNDPSIFAKLWKHLNDCEIFFF